MVYKKLFIDSDTLLDLFLQRQPFLKYSEVLLDSKFPGVELTTSTLVLANAHYFLRKYTNKLKAKELLKEALDILTVLPFEGYHILSAIDSDHPDLEDSFQYHIALKNNCNAIITRNLKDYKYSTIPVLTAEQFLREILK